MKDGSRLDINEEQKLKEQEKIDGFQIIMGLIIGAISYFGYYMLMTEFFEKDPFTWPYILISIYFVISVAFFPFAENRLSAWEANSESTIIKALTIPKTIMLMAFIFAPFIFIAEKLGSKN